MKRYEFEFTNQPYAIKLVLILFFILGFLGFTLFQIKDMIGIVLYLILTIGIPVLIFFLFKKNIKTYGSADLFENHIEFNLNNILIRVNYNEIMSYKTEFFNGALLILYFHKRKKLKILANENNVNPDQMIVFLEDFEKSIELYNHSPGNATINRKRSVLEHKWAFHVLVLITIVVIFAFIYSFFNGNRKIFQSLIAVSSLSTLWFFYFNTRKNRSKK